MQVAQALYEGVDLGASEGTVGLITYMRTDSTRISDQARDAAREFIVDTYGARVPRRQGSSRSTKAPKTRTRRFGRRRCCARRERLAGHLKREELRLYTLIWERFVASQMSAALFDQTVVDVEAAEYTVSARPAPSCASPALPASTTSQKEEEAAKGRVRLPRTQ